MFRKYLIPALALLGFISAVRTVFIGNAKPPLALPLVEPSRPPYLDSVAGAGMIEASSENIAVASPVSALVMRVAVKVGDTVAAGDLLFELDSRVQKAEVKLREAELAVAKARFIESQAALGLYDNLNDPRAVSKDDLIKRQSAVQISKASVEQAQSQLLLAQAQLDLLSVRAPIDGKILKVDLRPGEFAPAQTLSSPLIVMGNVDSLHVRVDVDENDAWRVKPNTEAIANLRGNPEIKFDLEFVRFEPFVIPKQSLTGDSTERVDTRVLQVIYRIRPSEKKPFVGQLVDVYINAQSEKSKVTQVESSDEK